MDLQQFLTIVRQRRRFILLSSLLVGLVAFAGSYLRASYQVTASVLVRPLGSAFESTTQPQVGMIPQQTATALDTAGQTYGAILKSRPVAERVFQRLQEREAADAGTRPRTLRDRVRPIILKLLGVRDVIVHLRPPASNLSPDELAIGEIQESLNGHLLPQSAVFQVTAKERHAELAVNLARFGAEAFVEFSRESNVFEASSVASFLEKQVVETRTQLDRAQEELRRFKAQHGILMALDAEASARVGQLIGLRDARDQLSVGLGQTEKKLERIRRDLTRYPEVVETSKTVAANPLVQQLRTSLIAYETELPSLTTDFTAEHPAVVAHRAKIADTRNRLNAEVERIVSQQITALNPVHQALLADLATSEVEVEASRERRRLLTAAAAKLQGELGTLPQVKIAWDKLNDDVSTLRTRLQELEARQNSAGLAQAKELSEIKIIDLGAPPRFPRWHGMPVLFYLVAGMFLGLFAAVGATMALHYAEPIVRTPTTVAELLEMPVYGVIGADGTDGKAASPAPVSYEYLSLKLRASTNGAALRSLVVTTVSSEGDPGPVSLGLATAAAASGARTCLMDIRSGHPLGAQRDSPLANLEIVVNGTADAAASWSGRRQTHDVLLCVAPPIDADAAAVRLATVPETDGLLIVVWEGKTSTAACLQAKAKLQGFAVNHAGVIYVR